MDFDPKFFGRSQPRRASVERLKDQILKAGWDGDLFTIARQSNPRSVFFNPAVRLENSKRPRHLFTRQCDWDGYWANCHNRITRFTIEGSILTNPVEIQYERTSPAESWEDPRVIEVGSTTILSVASWVGGQKAIVAHQRVAKLDSKDNVVEQWGPVFGNNGHNPLWNSGNEKNWSWFSHKGDLHFTYKVNPHVVVATSGTSIKCQYESKFDSPWRHGELRGGTNPVLINDREYLAFFHSSLPWKTIPKYGERRRYFMGAYTFEAKPPFKVTRITPQPLLTGCENDPTIPGSPAVVFPCGLVMEPSGSLYCTYGVNDCASGWVRMSVESVVDRMVEC